MNLKRRVNSFMGNNLIRDNRNIIEDLRKDSRSDLFSGDFSGFWDKRREMGDLNRENLKEIGKQDPRIWSPWFEYKKSTSLPARMYGSFFKKDPNYFKTDAQIKSEESGLMNRLEERRQGKAIDKDLERQERAANIHAKMNPTMNGPAVVINAGGAPGAQPDPFADPNAMNAKVGAPLEKGEALRNTFMYNIGENNQLSENAQKNFEGLDLERVMSEQANKDFESIYGRHGESPSRYQMNFRRGGNGPNPRPNPRPEPDPKPEEAPKNPSLYNDFTKKLMGDSLALRNAMGGQGHTPEQLLALGMLNERYSHDFANQAEKAEKELKRTFDTRLEDAIINSQVKSTGMDAGKKTTYNLLEDGLTSNMVGKFHYQYPDRKGEVDDLSKILGALNGAGPGVTVYTGDMKSPEGEKKAGLISDIGAKINHANFGNRTHNLNNIPQAKTRFEHDMMNSYLKERADDLLYMNFENPLPHQKAQLYMEKPVSDYRTTMANKPIGSSLLQRYYRSKYPEILGGDE